MSEMELLNPLQVVIPTVFALEKDATIIHSVVLVKTLGVFTTSVFVSQHVYLIYNQVLSFLPLIHVVIFTLVVIYSILVQELLSLS